jgi:penicillin-binding protein 1C
MVMGSEPEPDKKRRRRRWVRGVIRVVLVMVVVTGMLWWVVPWLVPWPEPLGRAPEAAAEIMDREGRSLRRLAGEDGRSAGMVRLGEVPEALVQATLAAEDQRFFGHGGVDVRAVARALRDGVVAGRAVSGASTITQQLVKVAVPRRRTMWTKVMEVLTARRIEMTWSKERILEEYLSRISYGSMATGCGEAAWTFFAKPLRDLSPAESAFLAGLPQAPGRLNPWRNPDRAKARQRWILGRMRVLGMLDGEVVERAMG